MKLSLYTSFALLLFQLWSADASAKGVARNQPVKMAAMEGVYETKPGTPMTIVGWVDEKNEKLHGIQIPGLLSWLTYGDSKKAVPGLKEVPKEDRPPVNWVFQTYHIMIYCWTAMMILSILGIIFLRKKTLEKQRWLLWLLIYSVIFPYLANTAGWYTAEIGRQPWIVQGVLRTSESHSPVLSAGVVLSSLLMFVAIYILLGSLFIFLLNRKIQNGPGAVVPENGLYRDVLAQEKT